MTTIEVWAEVLHLIFLAIIGYMAGAIIWEIILRPLGRGIRKLFSVIFN